MEQDLMRIYALVREQGEQISQLSQLLESNIAIREAQNTLLQSIIPFVKDKPDFARIVKDVHNVRLVHHAGNDINNQFVTSYNEAVNALLPAHLRFPPLEIKRGKSE